MSEKTFGKPETTDSGNVEEKPLEATRKPRIPEGYAFEENNDPIIIFFGQTKCGKTTALVRLLRYLEDKHPFEGVLSKKYHDVYKQKYNGNKTYEDIVKAFYTTRRAPIKENDGGTNDTFLCNISFKNSNKNERQRNCRILEAPGESLFPLKEADVVRNEKGELVNANWLSDIIDSEKFKRIWVFFLDPSFTYEGVDVLNNQWQMGRYVNHIKEIANRVPTDKFIFLINKCDKVNRGRDSMEDYINKNYDNILADEPFTRPGRFLGNINPHYQYDVLEFCAIAENNRREDATVNDGDEKYPQQLWDKIQDLIRQ